MSEHPDIVDAFRRGYEQAEAEHANGVWLTRVEAKRFRAWLEGSTKGYAAELYALLDERIGDRPTSIRAKMDGE